MSESFSEKLLDRLDAIEKRLATLEPSGVAKDAGFDPGGSSRFEAIFVRSLDGIMILRGAENIICLANPAAHQLLGYPLGQLTDVLFSSIYEPNWEMLDDTNASGMSSMQGIVGEVLMAQAFRRENGTLLVADLTMSWVDWEGEPSMLVTIRNATQRVEAEEKAEQMRLKALEESRLKSAFLANMSHEIRTPLNGIIGMTDLLMGSSLSEDQQEFATTVRSCGERLLGLINDILDISKIESGKLQLEEGNFKLSTCLEEAMDMIAFQAQKKGLDLGYLMDPGVPDFVVGDRMKFQQVMINLLTNAMKYTEKGSILLTVEVEELKGYEVHLCIKVQDTGMGIPEEMQGRVFNTFDQLEFEKSHKIEGTGLGLAISKKLVHLMGGEISLTSEVGKGSEFIVRLPITAQRNVVGTKTMNRQMSISELKVLVSDTHDLSCRILTEQLKVWHCKVTGVKSLEEVEAVLRKKKGIEILFLDFDLPGLSVKKVRSLYEQYEVFTVLTMPPFESALASDLLELGWVFKLSKPIRRSLLLDLLARSKGGKVPIAREQKGNGRVMPSVKKQRAHLLVAEDDEVNQRVLCLILQRAGYEMTVASNGEDALLMYEENPDHFDLILMDCQMPVMDGYTTTREIRLREMGNEHVPIIALTAFAIQGDREKCLDAGMDGYVAKPFQAKELCDVLESFLFSESAPRDSLEQEETNVKIRKVQPAKASFLSGDEPIYDPKPLEDLQEIVGDDDENLVEDLVWGFIEKMPGVAQEMKDAVSRGDYAACASIAHMQESRTGNIGARQVQALCHLIQEKSKLEQNDLLPGIVDQLIEVIEQARGVFKEAYPRIQ